MKVYISISSIPTTAFNEKVGLSRGLEIKWLPGSSSVSWFDLSLFACKMIHYVHHEVPGPSPLWRFNKEKGVWQKICIKDH